MTILSLGPGTLRPTEQELLSSGPPTTAPMLLLKLGELDLLMCVGVEQGVRLGLSNLVRTVRTNKPLRICCRNKMGTSGDLTSNGRTTPAKPTLEGNGGGGTQGR